MQHASNLYMSSPWCDLSETEFDTSVLHEDTGMPYAVFFKHAIPGCPVICCPAVAVFAPGPAHKQEHSVKAGQTLHECNICIIRAIV